jgi:steroid 5-alpha reductase family enzyme
MTLLLIIVLIACSLLMLVAWRVQQSSGNSSWVDVAWTFGTGLAGIVLTLTPLHHAPLSTRQIVVSVIVAVWSLRLGIHIMRRALRGKDDPRYAKLKESWGASYSWKMPGFLQLQALSVFMLACFIMLAGRNPAPGFGVLDVIALMWPCCRSAAKRSQTSRSIVSRAIRPTRARSARPGSGAGRVIPTTSSSG